MKAKKITIFVLLLMFFLYLITQTEKVTACVVDALSLCVSAVIPSLFPFFVLSGILVNSGLAALFGKILTPVSKFLFKTSGVGAFAFVIGIICGYPTGAKVIADMCKEKRLSQKEASRLLAFCNNSGPLFIIGAVGTNMMHNHSLGIALYMIHFLSAVFVGVLLRSFGKSEISVQKNIICASNISTAVGKSVESAVKSILNVCGYVVFFSIVCAMVKNAILVSVLEVTTGAKMLIAQGFSEKTTFILLSGAVGFGGICVLFQVQGEAVKAGMSLRFYALGKVIQALSSMAMAYMYVNIFEIKPVFSVMSAPESSINSVVIIFLSGAFYSLIRLTKKG